MSNQTESSRTVVLRFNQEVIGEGNVQSFEELMSPDFINHSAPPGMNNGPQGMITTFNNVLRPAMPDMKVTILRQTAEEDLVSTHKIISGTHTGTFLGIPATGKPISIEVMDMVRVRDGKYIEHWGMNSLAAVLAELGKS